MPRGIPNKPRVKKATAKAAAKKTTPKKTTPKKTAPKKDKLIPSLVNLAEVELAAILPQHEIDGLTAEKPIYYLIPLVIKREAIIHLFPIYFRQQHPNRPMPSIDSSEGKKFLREFFTTDIRSMLLQDAHTASKKTLSL